MWKTEQSAHIQLSRVGDYWDQRSGSKYFPNLTRDYMTIKG